MPGVEHGSTMAHGSQADGMYIPPVVYDIGTAEVYVTGAFDTVSYDLLQGKIEPRRHQSLAQPVENDAINIESSDKNTIFFILINSDSKGKS